MSFFFHALYSLGCIIFIIIIIIIIIIIGFLGLSWFCWYYIGCIVIPSLNVDGK